MQFALSKVKLLFVHEPYIMNVILPINYSTVQLLKIGPVLYFEVNLVYFAESIYVIAIAK
jgi:hypothetical protein